MLQNNCLPEHNVRCQETLIPRCQIREFDFSQPLTHCWNWSIYYAQTPWVLICNDDVLFEAGWKKKAADLIRKYPKCLQVNLAYPQSSFSAFLIHKRLIGLLGWFDPSFPAFRWEDEDWYLRVMERYGSFLGEKQKRGEPLPPQTIICWGEGIRNSPQQRNADIKRYGGLHWDLDPKRNEMAFWGKWRPDPKGILTKGQVRNGRRIRVVRQRGTPDFSAFAGVSLTMRERYREIQR